MRVTCEQCGRQFSFPDEKVPEGKELSVPCPNCKGPIKIAVERTTPVEPPPDPQIIELEEDDVIEKPFDFIAPGIKTALLCVDEKIAKDRTRQALEGAYHITEAKNVVDALKKIRAYPFDMVVIHERFEGVDPDDHPLITFFQRMSMESRRTIFVVFLTERYRTMDNLAAFKQSVNLMIHLKQMGNIGEILEKALAEHEAFYRVFMEVQGRL
jgi:CheY-like chemotaxis protein